MYGAIAVGTILVDRVTAMPGLGDYSHLALAALFLVTAIQLAQRRPGGLSAHGLALGGLLEPPPPLERQRTDGEDPSSRQGGDGEGALAELWDALGHALPIATRETGFALLVAALIFPPFAVGFYVFHGPDHPFTLQLPVDPINYVMAQLMVVALPEEALFRGYFQTRLRVRFPPRTRLLGAHVSLPALTIQAVLFALLHVVVDWNPVRLAVFFPGLLFGWLRSLRGGIGAAVVMHALSNLLSDVLVRGWL